MDLVAVWGTEQSEEESSKAQVGIELGLHRCGIRYKGVHLAAVKDTNEEYMVDKSKRETEREREFVLSWLKFVINTLENSMKLLILK